jgi:hypothetical protein
MPFAQYGIDCHNINLKYINMTLFFSMLMVLLALWHGVVSEMTEMDSTVGVCR